MRIIIVSTIMVILYFIYGFYVSQAEILVIPSALKKENPAGYYDYKGVMNVHSDLGIGSSTPLEIVDEAKKAGLDFIFLTDLNQFEVPPTFESYHGELLAFWGNQYNYLDNRITVYSGDRSRLPSSNEDEQLKLTDLLSQDRSQMKDAFIVLAHSNRQSPKWIGSLPSGVDALEIVNPKSMSERKWQDSKFSVIWSLFTYPFSPRLAFLRLLHEPRDEMIYWDYLNTESYISGIAGSGATARAIPLANYFLRFPSYQRHFEVATTHLLLKSELTGNIASDKVKIITALKNGHFYTSFDLIGDPKGFVAFTSKGDRNSLSGGTVKLEKDLFLNVHLGEEPKVFYETVIIRNGDRYKTFNQKNARLEITEDGVYRVMVRVIPFFPIPEGKKWIVWIYSNPFIVKK